MEKILSVNLQINIYIWPQEGTITQHYQSQQSSYIKADLPTLIYSLISELMSLFRAIERLHYTLRKMFRLLNLTEPRRPVLNGFICVGHDAFAFSVIFLHAY